MTPSVERDFLSDVLGEPPADPNYLGEFDTLDDALLAFRRELAREYPATPTPLPDGTWGAKVVVKAATPDVLPGTHILVTQRNRKKYRAVVTEVMSYGRGGTGGVKNTITVRCDRKEYL